MSSPYDVVGVIGPTEPVCGIVLDADRGSLPFRLIHGESLVAAAAWAVGAAGVDLLDLTVAWESVVESDQPLVLHDPLCPMTPPAFIAVCAQRALDDDVVVVGVRPVTDTVKAVGPDDVLGETVDRESLVAVCSPLVLPARVLADLVAIDAGLPSSDLAVLVDVLRRRVPAPQVVFVEAPPEARRVGDDADLALLEALTDARR